MKLRSLKNLLSLYFLRRNRPITLTFFVTSRCNCACEHCFYHKELNRKDELSLDEIRRIASKFRGLERLSLTGGEPFLRRDIAQIAKAFYDNKVRHISIPTNGVLTPKILKGVNEILKTCPDIVLFISVSFDSIGERHDALRGRKGVFKNAVNTLERLKELRKKHPNLVLGSSITCSSLNQKDMIQTYDYLKKDLGIETVNVSYIRGDVKDGDLKKFDNSNYKRAIGRVRDDILRRDYRPGIPSDFGSAVELLKFRYLDEFFDGKNKFLPCYAGKFIGVLYSDGGVYPCELLNREVGNIKDFDYDFNKLWESEKAKDIRKFILKSKCSCSHECFIPLNMLMNMRYAPLIFYHALRIKLKKYL